MNFTLSPQFVMSEGVLSLAAATGMVAGTLSAANFTIIGGLGTASTHATGDFATAAQGAKADSALQNAAAFDAAGAAATAQAFAIQRSNQTGTQAISTVTGLQTALDAKSALAGSSSLTTFSGGTFGTAAASAASAFATSAQGTKADSALQVSGAGSVYPYPVAASASLTAQNGAVTSICATTPGTAGVYRVAGYVTITAISVDVIQLQVTYTDETTASRTQIFSTVGGLASLSSTGAFIFPPFDIFSASGSAITMKTVLTTGAGSITYDVGASIQRIF